MPAPAPDKSSRTILPWIAAIAFFMQALDSTILNTALPSIAADLGYSPLSMQSVVVSYTITLALFIPLSGWLSDRFGTSNVFRVAVALFVLGSLACALSRDLSQLILSRILQGLGGSMMVPVARLAILYSYPKKLLMRVMNFVVIPGLVGPLIGPTLGGWLVELASWHWIFLINIPIGIFGIWMATSGMPNIKKPVGGFDTLGFILFSGALSLLTFCLESGSSGALGAGYIALFFAIALLLILLYIYHARGDGNPLINLNLFKIRTLRVALAGNLATRLGIGGFPLLLPLMLQVGFGYPASTAGMILIPMAAANLLTKPIVVPVIKRFGHKNTLIANTLVLAVIMALFALISAQTPLVWMVLLLLVYGTISSLQFTSMNTIAMADLDESNSSAANSVIAVNQQLSFSFGVSFTGFLLLNLSKLEPAGSGTVNTFKYTFLILAGITALSALVFAKLKPADGAKLSGHRG
ncbi:DHA2 family efflux MFS transporter permease subunit [Flavihumibacter stibioxidans]|uniref:MFS transporter n=1 Tax=Flavihumibacter stibioxidans TaxID=1834163 RepID=A0ABR7MCH4_9BACT|nr:DHA2 family efflux MFS transporter permease subunit [Flavihumibacter stibioxidans]MBC6492671.1 MFS transporter [Flavihumibacter stibioxidans]